MRLSLFSSRPVCSWPSQNGAAVTVKQLTLTQVGKVNYRRETVVLTATQRIEIKGVISKAGIQVASGGEAAGVGSLLQKMLDTAAQAGGAAPLPSQPRHLEGQGAASAFGQ